MSGIQSIGCTRTAWDLSPPQDKSIEMPDIDCTPIEQISAIDMNDRLDDKQFEVLIAEILSKAMHEDNRATLIVRNASLIAHEWQTKLMHDLENEHAVHNKREQRNAFVRRLSDLVMPLSLVAGGIMTVCTGGTSLVALGAAAIGGIFALDGLSETVLGTGAKKALASWLGQGNEEDTRAWLSRICVFTGVTTFALGLCIPGNQVVLLATNVSRFTVESTHVVTETMSNRQQARLVEYEQQWKVSSRNMNDMRESIDRFVQSVHQIILMGSDLHQSTMQVTSELFQRV